MPFSTTMKLRNSCYKYVLKGMGKDCNICDGVTIIHPENLTLGERVSIHEYCLIGATGEITIGDYVAVASHCILVSEDHIFLDKTKYIKEQGIKPKSININSDVWLGSRVTVLGNTQIGKGSVIGAGSVVTKDIPEYSVAVGNPCRVVKKR